MKLDNKRNFYFENKLPFFMGVVENIRNKSMIFRKYETNEYVLKYISASLNKLPSTKFNKYLINE